MSDRRKYKNEFIWIHLDMPSGSKMELKFIPPVDFATLKDMYCGCIPRAMTKDEIEAFAAKRVRIYQLDRLADEV